jgi:RNA-directed DNA polymerase
MKEQCSLVSKETKQEQDVDFTSIRQRWEWTESSVWTDKMLTALEKGVKGDKWFSLIDKVYSAENLLNAWKRVKANRGGAGVDNMTITFYSIHVEQRLLSLSEKLKKQEYKPNAIKRVMIDKPGSKEKRPLGIPTVEDRIVQTAIRNVIEPIFEIKFSDNSFGFRPKRSCKDALKIVYDNLNKGYHFVVDADLKGYFDTIPKSKLMDLVEDRISDGRVLNLIENFLNQSIFDGLDTWIPEKGTPQGAVLSPLLANIYLNGLDWLMDNNNYLMVRYADDFIIMCKTKESAEKALSIVKEWTDKAELILHPEKTKILDIMQDEIEFLGYRFVKSNNYDRTKLIWKFPKDKSIKKLKDSIRKHTRRTNGNSLEYIITKINLIIRGWFEYYKHSYKTTFPDIDGWIRRRLRSILKKFEKRKGIATTNRDNVRYPNKIFEDAGLFSLSKTHRQLCQSLAE